MLEDSQANHQDWGHEEDVACDQTPLLLRQNGDGGVDVDDSEAGVEQGPKHQQVFQAEEASLGKILTTHLQPHINCFPFPTCFHLSR